MIPVQSAVVAGGFSSISSRFKSPLVSWLSELEMRWSPLLPLVYDIRYWYGVPQLDFSNLFFEAHVTTRLA